MLAPWNCRREFFLTGLADVRGSPPDAGVVELVVRRPAVNQREIFAEGVLDVDAGLVGDTWPVRPSRFTPDRSPGSEMQLDVMNARVAALSGQPSREHWALAGDQLYVDFRPQRGQPVPGTLLAIGSAVIK